MLNSLFGSALILLFVFHVTNLLLRDDLQGVLEGEVRAVQAALVRQGVGGAMAQVDTLIGPDARLGAVVLLADHRGRRLAGNLEAWPETVPARTRWQELRLFPIDSAQSRLVGVVARPLPGGYRVLAGYGLTTVERTYEALGTAIALALCLGILFGLGGGALLARFVNRRVAAMGALAERFGAGARAERLTTFGTRDPFDRLGQALNTMLDQIEHLVDELRLVTDGLAHDLRSPLARLRSRGEQALKSDNAEAAQAAIGPMLREADTLLRMLSTMLEISRAEAGLGRDLIAPVDLADLCQELVEMYKPLAEDGGVEIAYAGPNALVRPINRELMAQAVSNLLDNALSYGGDRIRVELMEDKGRVRLAVTDNGPGIAEAQQPEALRRFGRLDPARRREGVGLGLALVAATARLHSGSFALSDNAPGLRATITLNIGRSI